MRSRKSRGLRGYSCGSASARGVSNDTSSSSWAGGVVDSLDRALLSSVSAKVMRLLGVSNDLRDRGDEWPLLKVVSGLSVVVATVVDEVSIAAPSALRFRSYLCGAQTWPLRLGCSSALARSGAALWTCRIAAQLLDCASNAGVPANLAKFRPFEIPARKPKAAKSSQASLRGFEGLKRTGRYLFMLFCFALRQGHFHRSRS